MVQYRAAIGVNAAEWFSFLAIPLMSLLILDAQALFVLQEKAEVHIALLLAYSQIRGMFFLAHSNPATFINLLTNLPPAHVVVHSAL